MLEGLLLILIDLLLNDVLLQYLVIELKWFLLNEVVIKALAVGWLNDIALRVHAVLVTLFSRSLMLTLKLLFLFNCMVMMIDETASWRDTELRYSTVI